MQRKPNAGKGPDQRSETGDPGQLPLFPSVPAPILSLSASSSPFEQALMFDERGDAKGDRDVDARPASVAEPALDARLLLVERLLLCLLRLAHAREPNRARALAAISRSPL